MRNVRLQGRDKWAGVLLSACLGCFAQAVLAQQVYKCTKGAQTSYQSTPCSGTSTSVSSAPAGAPAGGLPWEGLRPGMSLEEVRRITSAAPAPPNGSLLVLRKQGVFIAGMSFVADYTFDEFRRLLSVRLAAPAEQSVGLLRMSSNDKNLAIYAKLTAFFHSKYGAETSSSMKNKDTGFPGLAAGTEWSVDGGMLYVDISPVTAETSMLLIGMKFGAR